MFIFAALFILPAYLWPFGLALVLLRARR